MTDRKDLRIQRLGTPFDARIETDRYTPFTYTTNVGEHYYDIDASNVAEPYSYSDKDVEFRLTDAPSTILRIEFHSMEHPYISHVELRRVPPLQTRDESDSDALVLPLAPVIALDRFHSPKLRENKVDVSVLREVFLEVLPLYYRISWERETPTTIFDCGPVRWGSVGETIVCLDIEIASLEMTDEFDQRIAEGPLREWTPATISDLYLTYLDKG